MIVKCIKINKLYEFDLLNILEELKYLIEDWSIDLIEADLFLNFKYRYDFDRIKAALINKKINYEIIKVVEAI